MTYLVTLPGPEPTLDDAPFWSHCQAGRLHFQRCAACGLYRHPPAPACRGCGAAESEWVPAPDEAELFSFTVVHYAAIGGIAGDLPYNVAIVRYPSLGDVRLVSNVIDAEPGQLRIGMPLELVWETAGNGQKLPRYRPRCRAPS
jgi:uncharacterized OB-fold protein